MKNKTTEYPINLLREELRQRALAVSQKLSRSVGRLTSCDSLPCLEYGQEVAAEEALAQELFYLQHCRSALERVIACRSVTLRYRLPDGTNVRTQFRKVGPARVRVTALLGVDTPFPAENAA